MLVGAPRAAEKERLNGPASTRTMVSAYARETRGSGMDVGAAVAGAAGVVCWPVSSAGGGPTGSRCSATWNSAAVTGCTVPVAAVIAVLMSSSTNGGI